MNNAAHQNFMESLKDRLNRGLIDADAANVEMVRMERVRTVKNALTADLRRTLNAAVKRGELGHMKKDGTKPEVYFHPTFKYLAIAERNRELQRTIDALKSICI